MTSRQEMTISELARLMQVSVHQIRYFEEQQVLLPAYTEANGYRMYGLDEIYRLAHILLLRQLGLSVAEIRESLAAPSQARDKTRLERASALIGEELERLARRQRLIKDILAAQTSFEQLEGEIVAKRSEALYLTRLLTMAADEPLQARHLSCAGVPVADLFERDLYYIREADGRVGLYIKVEEAEADRVMPASLTISCAFVAEQEQEVERQAGRLETYVAEEGYARLGDAVLIERSYLSLFGGGGLHYELVQAVRERGV